MTTDHQEVPVGETVDFYCSCSGTDVPHEFLANLKPNPTCRVLMSVTSRCTYCGRKGVLS